MDATLIKETLEALLRHLDIPCDAIVVAADGDLIRVEVKTSVPSRLIGWHGETLNSVQHLLKSIVRVKKNLDRAPFIVLDVDGYRRMQEEKVCRIAEQKADFVRRTGSRIALPPMSPYFRRVVHMHVANAKNLEDLTTESVGEGDYRQIVLKLKNEKSRGSEELSPVIEAVPAGADGLENLDI